MFYPDPVHAGADGGGVSFSTKAIAVRRQLLPPTLACRHDLEFAADGRAMLALAAAACALHADA